LKFYKFEIILLFIHVDKAPLLKSRDDFSGAIIILTKAPAVKHYFSRF